MTGETQVLPWPEPSLPQPGARRPAPGDLALVQSFLNSHYDLEREHGADLFATPEALAGWLARRKLYGPGADPPITARHVERAQTVREALREMARGGPAPGGPPPAAVAALSQAAHGATLEVRFAARSADRAGPVDAAGPADLVTPSFLPVAAGGLERALAAVLAITATAMLDGRWARLKVCPAEDCGWAFYDHSRNQSGRWCSMAVCGGRAKARAHYRRRRGAGG
jgi:predicted RNA-binding Zn ribbon-like protein